MLIPLRHRAIPGNVSWTKEGHNFSWHVKLRDKDPAGFFIVTDRITGSRWEVLPQKYLTIRQTNEMTSRPHMTVEFARYLGDWMRDESYQDVEVRAVILASLNGKELHLLIDSDVDLTRVAYPGISHANLIVPLDVLPSLKIDGRWGY